MFKTSGQTAGLLGLAQFANSFERRLASWLGALVSCSSLLRVGPVGEASEEDGGELERAEDGVDGRRDRRRELGDGLRYLD